MNSNTFHFKGFTVIRAGIRCDIHLDRFSQQFNDAQWWLDNQIMTDMVPHMPFLTGTFINATQMRSRALAGTGIVIAGVGPMGRYLHEGKVMVNAATGKGPANIPGIGYRFPLGAKLMPTSRNLKYSNGRGAHWVDITLDEHRQEYVREVKRRGGGG